MGAFCSSDSIEDDDINYHHWINGDIPSVQ